MRRSLGSKVDVPNLEPMFEIRNRRSFDDRKKIRVYEHFPSKVYGTRIWIKQNWTDTIWNGRKNKTKTKNCMRRKRQILWLEWTGNKSGCGGGRMQFYQLNELENRAELLYVWKCMREVLASRAFYNLMYNFHVVLCFCSLLTRFANIRHIRFSFEAVKLKSSSDSFLLMAAKHSGKRGI